MQKGKKLLKKAYECGMSVGIGVMMLFFGAWFVIIGHVVGYEFKSLGLSGVGMFLIKVGGWVSIILGVGFIIYGRVVYSMLSKDVGEGD